MSVAPACTDAELALLVMDRSATVEMVVSTLSELLATLGSSIPALTTAELVIVPGSGGAVTVRVMSGASPAGRDGREQVTTLPSLPHVQPSPEALLKVTSAGRSSVTVIVDAVCGPLLAMLRV